MFCLFTSYGVSASNNFKESFSLPFPVPVYLRENITMALTYVCFIPARELVRGLSANSSNIAFEVPLASNFDGSNLALYHLRIPNCVIFHSTTKSVRILQWLALHTYVSSLPRNSSEAFQLTRQTSCLKSR